MQIIGEIDPRLKTFFFFIVQKWLHNYGFHPNKKTKTASYFADLLTDNDKEEKSSTR